VRHVFHRLLASMLLLALPAGVAAAAPLSVYTVNYPLAYFAQRIGGAEVKVTFPAPRDVDPAFWDPDAATVQRYQEADLIVLNGANYAHWVSRASLPRRKVVDTSRTFRERLLVIEGATTHSHGPSGSHSHAGTAFVTWLDPLQAIEQARAVRDAFARNRPAVKGQFDARYELLEQDLVALDLELKAGFASLAGKSGLASHPIYQYLARRYGLELKSFTWEPDEMPDAAEWRKLEEMLKTRPAGWMLWERAPLPAIVSRLKALGVVVIVFDPIPNVPDSGDFMTVMRQNVRSVQVATR